jgi:hypothetical protein
VWLRIELYSPVSPRSSMSRKDQAHARAGISPIAQMISLLSFCMCLAHALLRLLGVRVAHSVGRLRSPNQPHAAATWTSFFVILRGEGISSYGSDVDGVCWHSNAGRDPLTDGPPATCLRRGLTDEMTHRCSLRVLRNAIPHTAHPRDAIGRTPM